MGFGRKQNTELQFDEATHTYTLDGKVLTSVTTWIHSQFCKPFDSLNVAKGVKRASNNKDQFCLAPQDLVRYWNLLGSRAAHAGTAVHIFSEMYDMNPMGTHPEVPKEEAYVRFINKALSKYEIVGTEYRVYNAAFGLAGTVDRKLRNRKTGQYILADLKTSTNLERSYNKMINELSSYQQTKINEYRAQLTTYKYMDKDEISELWIVNLKNDGTYEVIKVDEIPEIKIALQNRTNYEELLKHL